jgi:hypothetical protein
VRDEQGEWRRIERYLADREKVQYSHGVCPDCASTQQAEEDRMDSADA